MIRLHRIENLDRPELVPYATLRRQDEHRRQGVFVVEGYRVLERLLETDLRVVSCLFPEKWLPHFREALEVRPEMIDVHLAPIEEMERMTGFTFYQGVLAVAQIPPPVSLDSFLTSGVPRRPLLLAAAEGIHNSQNMGVIIRNAAALGVQAIIVGETSCSPFVRLAVRSSMGTIFKVAVIETHSLHEALRTLRTHGVKTVAAHPAGGRRLSDLDLRGDVCILLGNEGEGLRAETVALCDDAAGIPMASGVDSLNVSNAAAIFFYEAGRQREPST